MRGRVKNCRHQVIFRRVVFARIVFANIIVALTVGCAPPPPAPPKARSLSEIDAEVKRVKNNPEMQTQEKAGNLYGLSREREVAVRAGAAK